MTSHNKNPQPPSHTSHKRPLLWGGALLLLCALGYGLWPSHKNQPHPNKSAAAQVQPVAIAQAVRGSIPVIFTELGTVVPLATVTIQSRISGYLEEVLFTEGQMVHKGDILAQIDDRPYRALKAQYEGSLAADTALLQQARLDNSRYQTLRRQNSIAPMTAQDQVYKVAQLEGQVKTDKAMIRQQELDIMYCRITAPVSGRIGIRQVDKGNYITAGQNGGLAVLTQVEPVSVIFTLPETRIAMVAEQMRKQPRLPLEAWNSDNSTKLADGFVEVLDNQIDTATGTVRMRGIFPNKDQALFPNQFVNARLKVKTLQDVLLIPTRGVQTGPNGPFVYLVTDDNKVTVRQVKTGFSNSENTVVTAGLSEHDRVVTAGTDHLREGSKVSIAPAEPNTGPKAPPP